MKFVMRIEDDGFERINEYSEFTEGDYYTTGPAGTYGLCLHVNKTVYYAEIRTDDYGNIPHFHLFNKDESFLTCISLEDSTYFLHGPYQGKLDSKSRKLLDKFLRKGDLDAETGKMVTNWDRLVNDWNRNEDRTPVKNVPMPNYRNLPPKED